VFNKSRPTRWLALGVAALAAAAAITVPYQVGALPRAYGAASANSSASRVDRRGELVSAEHLRTLTAAQAAAELASDRFDPGTVRYGVDTWRLVYRTIDPPGAADHRQRPARAATQPRSPASDRVVHARDGAVQGRRALGGP
jgi:hypothetical protein